MRAKCIGLKGQWLLIEEPAIQIPGFEKMLEIKGVGLFQTWKKAIAILFNIQYHVLAVQE